MIRGECWKLAIFWFVWLCSKVSIVQPKNLVRNNPNGTVLTHNTEIEDNSNAEEAFENILDDDTNAKQVDEEMEITTKLELGLEKITDDPNSKKVIKTVPIEEDGPENILDSNYRTIVYDTEDITLKEETLDYIPDDLNANRVGNVNETVIIHGLLNRWTDIFILPRPI